MKNCNLSKLLCSTALAIFTLFVISCYDDSELRGRLDDYELRLQALEKLCAEMNTNISSLQQIVTALQNNDYVTDIVTVMESGKVVGYTITFSKSGPVTIYHGKDGKDGTYGKDGTDGVDGRDGIDGSTPVVGLRQDSDGIWYWTLDGEWLLDGEGNKVKAVGIDGKDGENGKDGEDGKDGENGKDGKDGQDGKDGADGVTPQLKIKDDYWYISYDQGQTWTLLERATGKDGLDGEDGKDGKDGKDGRNGRDGTNGTSFFQSVTQDTDHVYLTLADGSVITLPKFLPLSITFSNTADTLEMATHALLKIDYQFKAATENVHIDAICSSDLTIILTGPVVTENEGVYYGEGTLNIQSGDRVSAWSKVTVFLSDDRTLLMRHYAFKEKKKTN